MDLFLFYLILVKQIEEKYICKNLMSFIECNNILYNRQYGLRRSLIVHTLIDFTKKNANAFENNNLSKAFDCLDQNILIDKLYFYGIRGVALHFIKSFLTNRKQFVNIDNCSSSYLDILLGVPKGSNLGPLLFLLYTVGHKDGIK